MVMMHRTTRVVSRGSVPQHLMAGSDPLSSKALLVETQNSSTVSSCEILVLIGRVDGCRSEHGLAKAHFKHGGSVRSETCRCA